MGRWLCEARFTVLADEVNSERHVICWFAAPLNDDAKPLRGSRTVVLG